jgi:PIN domain nuclease of toxin-antitoxin system
MTEVVLDASAVLAMMLDEPGGDRVAALLPSARISVANLAEVAQRLSVGWSDDLVLSTLSSLPCKMVDLNERMALRAGLLRAPTRARGLSLGDRTCLALAEQEGLPTVTADRAWASLDLGVEVVLIR